MGKKRRNSKARNNAEVEIDNSAAEKVFTLNTFYNCMTKSILRRRVPAQITLDIEHRAEDYDNCNALVLPSEKRKTKSKVKNVAVTQLLSKKRRKQLEKVVEKKQKKLRVSYLLRITFCILTDRLMRV